MALLAGDRVWQDSASGPPTARERAAAGAMITALAVTVLVQWVALTSSVDLFGADRLASRDRDLVILTVAGALAAGMLAIRPARLVAGQRHGAAAFWWSLWWRGSSYLILIVSMAAVLPRLRLLGAVPLGLVGGADALLTMWALGLTSRPRVWLKRLVFGGVHFGALGALVGAIVFDADGPSPRTVLGIYTAMWTGIAVAGVTVLTANHAVELAEAQRRADQDDLRARERALRVHWLHDDVLSEVKLATLRMEDGGGVPAARRELHELDHRLRLRQLDEILRGGRPHLYEIIQPHLRRAQTLGVRLDRVPSLDATSMQVDEATGELIHRAISNLLSNALNAGATRLALDIAEIAEPPALELSVTDDAGGFSLSATEPGRGLSLLERDLGNGTVRRADIPGGSVVTVRLPLDTSAIRPQKDTPP